MPQTVPFAVLPLPAMKRVIVPFIGLGYRVSKWFPYLELELQQAGIDADTEEYSAIMVFNFAFYFLAFAVLGSVLLSKFVTKTHLVAGVAIPESAILATTIGLIVSFLIFIQMSMYPKIKTKKKIRAIELNILYALRTMLVQIKSGISLFDSLSLIADGDFGQLSKEFKKAVDEINTGVSEGAALQKIATENPSPYLRKVIWQLINGLKAGADVADVLNESVSSMTRQQEIEIQKYGGSLRVFSLIYLMIGVIIPALGATFLIVLGSFPKIEIGEMAFWTLLGFVAVAQFMLLGMIKSKRPNLMGA